MANVVIEVPEGDDTEIVRKRVKRIIWFLVSDRFERLLRLLLLDEVRRDWPELYNIHLRLRQGEELRDEDRAWIREVAEATG